jgi:hypothetical protein
MTKVGDRLPHVQRRADLVQMIDRQDSLDALDWLQRTAGHEFDPDLREQHRRRVQAVRSGRA